MPNFICDGMLSASQNVLQLIVPPIQYSQPIDKTEVAQGLDRKQKQVLCCIPTLQKVPTDTPFTGFTASVKRSISLVVS